ncbi:HNH endonuclease [Mesorhizobium sp. BR1-1-16]|uniref:HNH endonuclease n=1 Tax=Mesorhizobium sp. BR1-1-16 TaxID=2876653 RepID=UPI001CCD0A6C|nr:HNH endonuclease signature motif containing protein [Mesorhizobium sp. BR1-1-16]MBZ9939182.1 HNH endonuclease [Mesorhizobium sp. BR1-1-16]
MSRREFPAKIRQQAFARSQGNCESCGAHLYPGKFAYDHVIPDALGGEPVLTNCEVLCDNCHGAKTTGTDVPRIAKARNQQRSYIDAKTRKGRPMPGTKASGLRKKMNGTVERW